MWKLECSDCNDNSTPNSQHEQGDTNIQVFVGNIKYEWKHTQHPTQHIHNLQSTMSNVRNPDARRQTLSGANSNQEETHAQNGKELYITHMNTRFTVVIDQALTIQFIEFTYCNDRFSLETLEAKANKYKPLLENIAALGWKIDPLIVITAGTRAATHIPSMKLLEDKFKLPMPSIRNTFKNINTIAIQYAMSILLHKRRLENHQPLPQIQDPP